MLPPLTPKQQLPSLKGETGIPLVPPLPPSPVAPKLDLALECLRDLYTVPMPALHPQTFSFSGCRLQPGCGDFSNLPGICNVQQTLGTAILDQTPAVNFNLGLSFGVGWEGVEEFQGYAEVTEAVCRDMGPAGRAHISDGAPSSGGSLGRNPSGISHSGAQRKGTGTQSSPRLFR